MNCGAYVPCQNCRRGYNLISYLSTGAVRGTHEWVCDGCLLRERL